MLREEDLETSDKGKRTGKDIRLRKRGLRETGPSEEY